MESGSFFTVISSSFYGEIESEYHLLFLLLFTKVYTINYLVLSLFQILYHSNSAV